MALTASVIRFHEPENPMRRTSHECIRWIHRPQSSAAGLAGLVLFPVAALCQDLASVLDDSFHISLGAFLVDTDTKLRLDGEAGEQGRQIDWERSFGEGDVNRFRVDGYWRFAERHKLRALVFSSSRSASRTFDEDIEWGGETYPASATIDGEIKFSIYELAYEYAFMRRDNFELDASIGLHYADFEASLGAEVAIGGTAANRRIDRSGNIGAPLPVFGLRGTWLLSRTFSIDVSGQFFSLTYGDIEGNVQDYRATLSWQPKRWLGLGIGYDRFSVDVDVNGSNFKGEMDWSYQGPMIFYSASF
jgi:hypothetical protein